MQPSIRRIALAEIAFLALLAIVLAAGWAGLGPDGTAASYILAAVILGVGALLILLPFFLFPAIRELARAKSARTHTQLAVVLAGIILWLVLMGWVISLFAGFPLRRS